MATARLRHTFKYPSDENEPEEMDEEEQERLIQSLTMSSQKADKIYTSIFSLLPLTVSPAFLYYALTSHSNSSVKLLSLLAITSLLATAFNMWITPTSSQDLDGKKRSVASVQEVPIMGRIESDGPLARSVPVLNYVICGLLGLASLGLRTRSGREGVPEGFWVFLLLPAVTLGVVVVARRSMKEVDQGIGDLSQLRYGFKGA